MRRSENLASNVLKDSKYYLYLIIKDNFWKQYSQISLLLLLNLEALTQRLTVAMPRENLCTCLAHIFLPWSHLQLSLAPSQALSWGVSACLMRLCSSLSSSYFPSHFCSLSSSVAHGISTSDLTSPCRGIKVSGEGDHASTLSPPSLLLTLVQTVSWSWHKHLCRCNLKKSSRFLFVQPLKPFAPPRLSHSESAQLTQLAMLSCSLLQFIASTAFSIVSQ